MPFLKLEKWLFLLRFLNNFFPREDKKWDDILYVMYGLHMDYIWYMDYVFMLFHQISVISREFLLVKEFTE